MFLMGVHSSICTWYFNPVTQNPPWPFRREASVLGSSAFRQHLQDLVQGAGLGVSRGGEGSKRSP